MYSQELNRDKVTPSYQKLSKLVRQRINQMVRTRNFKAPNERFQRGALVKSLKGRNVTVERKVGECFQWKATGQCSKGDSCSTGLFWSKSTIILFYFENPETASQELRDKVNGLNEEKELILRSGDSEQLWNVTRSQSTLENSEHQGCA